MSALEMSPRQSPHVSDEVLQNMRILIVDDRPSNVLMVERVLSTAGYTRLESTSYPTEVEDLCEEFVPDLLLLDLHMQPLDGFEIMSRLEPMRVWVFASEVPDGTWGAVGRINTLADIAGFAMGDAEKGRRYAERRFAERRGEPASV